MLYAFAYPVGDYLHLSVLVQVHFQICNSSALGSKRICKKTRKKKLFCFQLISLPISENKKNKAIQKGVSSQPAISNAIILINTEEKKPYTVYLVQNIITGNHSAWSCAQEFYIHISSFNWGLIGFGSYFLPLFSFPDTAFGTEVSGRFLSVTFLKHVAC